jgi:hypothetical protein
MTDYLVLTDFVPGTKAKAQEVNANFSAVKDAINSKATVAGDDTQTFSVASATEDAHAVTKSQLDTVVEEFTDKINSATPKFCVKSGNITSGKGDLFSYSSLTITPKVGGSYANMVISDCTGVFTEISSVAAISMSGKPDGIYHIFVNADGVPYTLKNTIYRQETRPTMIDGDVWLNTSVEPIGAVKYNGTSDVEFLGVPLGAVTIASSAITALETFAFNENGYDVTTHTALTSGTTLAKSITDLPYVKYNSGVSKTAGVQYTAECSGLLVWLVTYFDNAVYTITLEGVAVGYSQTGNQYNHRFSLSYPIMKGQTYYVSGGSLIFYPAKGAS